MTSQKLLPVGLGRIRHALGDGATEQQARLVYGLLDRHGLLGSAASELLAERIIGLAEAAEMMNRSPGSVRQWKHFPEPVVRLKSGPIYDREHVERFRIAHPELCGVMS